MPDPGQAVAAVVIGRNEGDRLVRCLASLARKVQRIVYVDSGSTDGSMETARRAGAEVVALDSSRPFTAARARNAGLDRLETGTILPEFVQFVDGDCEVREGWIDAARVFLEARPDVAVVCGRLRERRPEASVWNRLIDAEWDTAIGEAAACGGNAMMRWEALRAAGGFDGTLIAGEEPELCFRLRRAGWTIHRIDAEMTFHDAAMTHFSQWWKRARRAGHAYAEGAAMHGAGPERYMVAETRRALVWGAGVPAAAAVAALVTPWGLVLLVAWPLQILRLGLRDGDWVRATFLTLGKIPEAQGAIGCSLGRLLGRRPKLIEYK